ncbi:MAG: protein kinase [Parachlamydia sp.]|nr:protein kinase [Parachlamydia sp.]
MQAAQPPLVTPGNQGWQQPGAVKISEDIATARLKKIQEQFAAITFIPDRPAAAVLQTLSQLHYSQFPVDPGLDKKQVNWIVVEPARSPLTPDKSTKERRIFCVRRADNTLEALMPVKHVLKNPFMKTGRFAYKVIFSPANQREVQLKPAFLLTSVYPASPLQEVEIAQKQMLDYEVQLRLHLNNSATHFPRLENWGIKRGHHNHKPCAKLMMEDECLELNLLQYFNLYPDTSERAVLGIVIRVLEALEKLYQGGHHQGYVHCDIKRENVILKQSEGKWIAYLTDVGLARLIGMEVAYYSGTPVAWPPEYWNAVLENSSVKYYETFDLWQCGMLAWEMLHKVHTQQQWPEFKKAQYNVGLVRRPGSEFKDIDSAFLKVFSYDRYADQDDCNRATSEKANFVRWLVSNNKYSKFSKEALLAYLIEKWREELTKFEASIATDHPQMIWLQRLLRVNPDERQSIQQTLQQLNEYYKTLPDVAPTAPTKPLILPNPLSNIVKKTDTAAQEVLMDDLLTSEINTQFLGKQLKESTAGSWWSWSWITTGWGKGNCSLQ